MKSVKGHGCRRQVLGRAGDEGLGHVHAHHFDGLGLALVGLEVPHKALDRAGVFAGCGIDQPRLLQVVHQRDVVLAFGAAGLVDADDDNPGVAFLRPGPLDVGIDLAPQGVVRAAKDACAGGHGHLARQRQAQRLKQQREAAALARPGHLELGDGAAAATGHARQLAVHVGFELKEVQMAPAALAVVVQFLIDCATGRARRAPGLPDDVQVDSTALNIQRHALYRPRRCQSQRLAKQGLLHAALLRDVCLSTHYCQLLRATRNGREPGFYAFFCTGSTREASQTMTSTGTPSSAVAVKKLA
ncbi:MAG: hypothetical protein BWX79_00090 [Alphaproteobacteria bacterium ADurb.Bin100]|nr:MAG: hypothetical protein BWX79_00090 [Alphaproteobacteria bacterium ADurb.Bin100]